MSISQESKDKLVENNRRITELLRENEEILRQAGYNPPLTNYVLERSEKIGFPPGYIRTVSLFISKYHLSEICPNRVVRHNITYALEASDLINFILNRINIWGSVETILYKLAIVNLVSVIEALVLEAANNNICCRANQCRNTAKCYNHFSKNERGNARLAIDKLVLIGVLEYDETKVARIKDIIDLRNRIHIRLTKGNEMNLDDFTIDLYNEVITLLQDIDQQIFEKAVPKYYCKIT